MEEVNLKVKKARGLRRTVCCCIWVDKGSSAPGSRRDGGIRLCLQATCAISGCQCTFSIYRHRVEPHVCVI